MIKNILNLEGVTLLTKEQQKSMNGSYRTWCHRKHTENLIDLRPGAPKPLVGFLNSNGCWVYPGMPWNANPDCAPNDPMYSISGLSGNACRYN